MRAGRGVDLIAMQSTQTKRPIPKPITVVLERHAALQSAFVRHRAFHDKRTAFLEAISSVLSADEAHDLFELISGSYDRAYDAQRGSEFGRLMLDDLEQSYQDLRRLEAQTKRWEHMDALAAVDALTADVGLATLYAQTLDEHDEATARVLVSTAVQTIVDKASAARIPIGKRRTLERARSILEQRAAPSQDGTDIRAVWSRAIYLELEHERQSVSSAVR
jgi:hypothetical protein